MEKIVIYGAGNQARVVIDSVEKEQKYNVIGLIDDEKPEGTEVLGYKVIGNKQKLLSLLGSGIRLCIIAIGDNKVRKEKAEYIMEKSFSLVSVKHPFCSVGKGTSIGAGTVIFHGVVIDPEVSIGKCVIINDNTLVGHNSKIGDFAHISAGVNFGGGSVIEENSFIGMGVTVIPNIHIGKNVFIGAGSLIARDIPDDMKVIGFMRKTMINRINKEVKPDNKEYT
ncbi:MAG: acetyltransferase [Candidatus Omnitrophica bacterium]|nr:acetyltransferase [Candidatus Omnitrophota bacterium]MDD5429607.1 acetyltransferase [Candidatus Omnitrophota bacterium]